MNWQKAKKWRKFSEPPKQNRQITANTEQRIPALKYGKYADEQWTAEEVLKLAARHSMTVGKADGPGQIVATPAGVQSFFEIMNVKTTIGGYA